MSKWGLSVDEMEGGGEHLRGGGCEAERGIWLLRVMFISLLIVFGWFGLIYHPRRRDAKSVKIKKSKKGSKVTKFKIRCSRVSG